MLSSFYLSCKEQHLRSQPSSARPPCNKTHPQTRHPACRGLFPHRLILEAQTCRTKCQLPSSPTPTQWKCTWGWFVFANVFLLYSWCLVWNSLESVRIIASENEQRCVAWRVFFNKHFYKKYNIAFSSVCPKLKRKKKTRLDAEYLL